MADEIRTTLGFEADAAIATLQRIQSELNQYNTAINAAAAGTQAYNAAGSRFDRTVSKSVSTLNQLAATAGQAATKLTSLASAQQTLASSAGAQRNTLETRLRDVRAAELQALAIRDLAKARELNANAARLESQIDLRNSLRRRQATRATRAATGQAAPGGGQQQIEATVKRIKKAQDDAAASQQNLRAQTRSTEVALRNAFRGGEEGAKKLGTTLQDTGKKGEQAGKAVLISWQSVARIFTIQVIHQAVTTLSRAFTDGISSAQDYQKGLSEVQTIGDDLNLTLPELDEKVRLLSDAFGQPVDVVTEGLYQTLSNQVVDASDAFDFLATANRFATAAVTDTGSSVNLLSSAIKSFGLDASDTEDVAAKLFKTVELGRVRAEELANTFGRVGVLSNQLGVSLDETLASIAILTVQGLRFNEAFTLLTNTQLKLIRPTDALKATFAELGVTSAEAGIQAFGFQGFLEELTRASGGTATEIGELFNRVRAIRGVLGLTAGEGEKFTEVLEEIKAATGEVTLDEAFKKVFETDSARFARELNSLKNVFVTDFGQGALTVLANISNFFGGAGDAVKSLALGLGVATVAVAGISAATAIASFTFVGFTASVSAAAAATVAFVATPIGAFLAIAGAVTVAAIAYDGLTTSVKEATEAQIRQNKDGVEDAVRTEQLRRRTIQTSEDEILSSTQRFLTRKQQLFLKDAEFARQIQEVALGGVADQAVDRLSAVESFVSKLRSAAQDSVDAIRDLRQELEGVGDNLEQFNFDRSIRGLNNTQKTLAQIERSQENLRAANDALAKGDFERAATLQQIAEQSAKAALSTADASGNAATQRRAEEAVRDVLRDKSGLLQSQIDAKQTEANLAVQISTAEEARLTRLKLLVEELKKFEAISKELVIDPKFSPEKAKAQLKGITEQIKQEFRAAAGSADLLGNFNLDFDALRNQIREGFRDPITGVVIDLTDAVQINLDRIADRLNQQAASLTSGQTEKLASLGVDIQSLGRGFADAQKQIQAVPKAIDQASVATRQLISDQVTLDNAFLSAAGSFAQFSALADSAESRGRIAGIFDTKDAEGFTGFIANAGGAINTFIQETIAGQDELQVGSEALTATLTASLANFRAALAAGDPGGALQAIQDFRTAGIALDKLGFTNLSQKLRDVSTNLGEILDKTDQINLGASTAAGLEPLERQVQSVGDAFDDTSQSAKAVAAAAQQGAAGVSSAEASKRQQIQQTTRAYEAQNRAAAGGGSTAAAQQFGGLLHRQLGGLAYDRRQFGGQRGTDSIPTLLTAGESVNDLAATRRFFPQIQAMNAGVIPQFREQGGVVNQSIGDISINVTESASGRDTAREVMKEIKREFRRNTFNIGRV